MSDRSHRKLAAIVAADVAGYSRLMGVDEEGTLAALKAHRNAIDPVIFSHGGRIVKTTGDGLLMVAAVRAALQVQRIMAERAALLPADRRMQFRIGVHVGEVIAEQDDLFGDTVNVAARLQEVAAPGGIALSGAARDAVYRQIEAPLLDLGPQPLKNIAEPVPVWRVEMGETEQAGLVAAAARAPRERSAVAVLPFDNMSADPAQEYFADGLAEDLITALSGIRELKVIARNSSFAYRGKARDVKLIAAELDARYVLEGSVRKAGPRVRVTAQLIDATGGQHIWAERYDRDLTDIFALQDELTANIASRVAPTVRHHEIEAARKRTPRDLDTWDLYLRMLYHYNRLTQADFDTARDLCEQIIARDEGFAPAYYFSALLIFFGAQQRFVSLTPALWQEMLHRAERGVALAPGDVVAQGVLSSAYAFAGRYQEALQHGHEARRLNPYVPMSHLALGTAQWMNGDHADAVPTLEMAWRLGSHDPERHHFSAILSFAHYQLRQYEAALSWADQCLKVWPDHLHAIGCRAASLAQLGRLAEARAALEPFRARLPGVTASQHLRHFTWRRPEDTAHYREGLFKAGLPE